MGWPIGIIRTACVMMVDLVGGPDDARNADAAVPT